MSFELFKARVNKLIENAGGGISVDFSHDDDKGVHIARCSDGTTIIGNSQYPRVKVSYNRGNHVFAATL